MASTTTRYAFPYQELTDAPNGASLGKNLAEAVENKLGIVEDARIAADAALSSRVTNLEGRIVLAKRKGTTTSRSSTTTTANDPDLKVTLAASTFYWMTGTLVYNGLSAANLKGGLYGPASSFANGVYQAMPTSVTTGTSGVVTMGAVGFGNGFVFTCTGTGTDLIAMFHLLVYSGVGGDVGFTWAQNTSNATATTLKADSTFVFVPIVP